MKRTVIVKAGISEMFKRFTINSSRLKILFGMVMFLWAANLFPAGPDTLWTRIWGGNSDDMAFSVRVLLERKGFIVAGYSNSEELGTQTADGWLIKADSLGDSLWGRFYGGTDQEKFYSGEVVPDTSGYICLGYTKSFGAGAEDFYLVKTDTAGDTIWTRTYGGTDVEIGQYVEPLVDGGFILTGSTKSYGAGDYDVYLVKIDSVGDTLWTRTYGGSGEDEGYEVHQCPDGGYIITGYTKSSEISNGDYDAYLIKTDSIGDTAWTKAYGGETEDKAHSVKPCSDGGYILLGYTFSFGNPSADLWLIKTDSIGDTTWTKTYGGIVDDFGEEVFEDTIEAGFFFTGKTQSFGAGDKDVWLVRTDTLGDTLWTMIWGGENDDRGHSVAFVPWDSGYLIAGYTKTYGPANEDIWLIRTGLGEPYDPPVGIEEVEFSERDFSLSQNYPNPFLGRTTIKYAVPSKVNVTLKIYDISGRIVKTIFDKEIEAGSYTVIWDGRNNSGKKVPGGIYFLRFKTEKHNFTRKMLKMKQ